MRARRRSGVALVLAVIVLAILIVVVLELVFTARVEQALARNLSEGKQADMAADAAVELARALVEPPASGGPDTADSRWAGRRSGIKLGEAVVDMEITDEASKLNLRLLVSENEAVRKWAEEALLRLVKSARTKNAGEAEESDEIEPDKIVERMVEWARKGETGSGLRISGVKAGEEETGLRLLGLSELLFLEGVTPAILFGEEKTPEELELERKEIEEGESEDDLLPAGEEPEEENLPLAGVLTVHGDGRVNVNTACREVLMALHEGITSEVAEKIISHRIAEPGSAEEAGQPAPPAPPAGQGSEPDPTAEKWFQNVAELRGVEGMVDSAKQLDVMRDLLRLAGKSPAQGKDAVEDWADAPLAVKSGFFKAVIWVKCGTVFRTYTAVLKRKSGGGVLVVSRQEGRQ